MSHSVPQVEGFAQAAFRGILLHNVRFELDVFFHHREQRSIVGRCDVKLQMLHEHLLVFEQRMLEHFGISRAEILFVERPQKFCAHNDVVCLLECADFVLISAKIDACLPADGGIDHREQRCGHIHEANAALEGGCRKTAQVGHHAASDIDEQRVACGAGLLEFLPNVDKGFDVLVVIARTHHNGVRSDGTLQLQFLRNVTSVRVGKPHHSVCSGKCVNDRAKGAGCVVSIEYRLHFLGEFSTASRWSKRLLGGAGFILFDGPAIVGGNFDRVPLFEVDTHHYGLSLADYALRLLVHGTLLEGETLIAQTTHSRFDDNPVFVVDGLDEVGMNTGYQRDDALQTEVRTEHRGEVVFFSEVVKGEIHVVVHVLIRIEIVETDLDRGAMTEVFSHEGEILFDCCGESPHL